MAITVTHSSAATATATWMFIEWFKNGKPPSVLGPATGAIAGLAAITPASGFVGPIGGLVIGFASGVICWWAATVLKTKLGYDDSLDVVGVHGVGGLVGTILCGVFAAKQFGGNAGDEFSIGSAVGVQALACGVTIVWTIVATAIILKVIDVVVGLRVTEAQEDEALDITLHEESGYNY